MPPRKRKKKLDSDIKKGLITGITALAVTSGEKIITWVLNLLTPKAAPNPVLSLEPTARAMKPIIVPTPWYRYITIIFVIGLVIASIIYFYRYFKTKKQ